MHITHSQLHTKKGFAILLSIIMISAFSLSVSFLLGNIALTSDDVSDRSLSYETVRYASEGCVEQALLRIHDNNNYSGTEQYVVGSVTCTFTVTNLGGDSRQIRVTGDSSSHFVNIELVTNSLSPVSYSWTDSTSF